MNKFLIDDFYNFIDLNYFHFLFFYLKFNFKINFIIWFLLKIQLINFIESKIYELNLLIIWHQTNFNQLKVLIICGD